MEALSPKNASRSPKAITKECSEDSNNKTC